MFEFLGYVRTCIPEMEKHIFLTIILNMMDMSFGFVVCFPKLSKPKLVI